MLALTPDEQERYKRQMLLSDWGEEGQLRLKSSKVFIAGAGGLGSAVATYLASAGVGEIRICDSDRVEPSNLNRQILHDDSMVGELKALSAEKTLKASNPSIKVTSCSERLDSSNAHSIIGHPDIIIDCLDNYETRFVLNSYSVEQGIPLAHAAVTGFRGQIMLLHPPITPCLRCLLPDDVDSGPAPGPALGAAVGMVGCIEALEVIKYLTGICTPLLGRLLVLDGAEMVFKTLVVEKSSSCPECGARNEIDLS
ncbi:MAG: HesA/MoeB/ThiF family protein [Actinobacteria bacterium]|nr:HesA/MoeB/ThiF family protein [Actinomycetota bacterium]